MHTNNAKTEFTDVLPGQMDANGKVVYLLVNPFENPSLNNTLNISLAPHPFRPRLYNHLGIIVNARAFQPVKLEEFTQVND